MKTHPYLPALLRVVAVIQLALGVAYLVAPGPFLEAIGHTLPEDDIFYPLGMLAARFLAYGVAFWLIAREPAKHALWITMMIVIQLIDLGVGVFYTATDVVAFADAAFPMFNATWITVLLFLWRPRLGSAVSPAGDSVATV